ncbi:MAG: sigma 54-interacting transcriptional regulator, partial [Desulfosudaceae bacterium]
MDQSVPDKPIEQQISELQQKIVSYKKSNQFFEMLVRSLPGLFYLFDSKYKVLKWNRNLERVTGYTREEIATRSLFDLFEGTDLERVKKVIKNVFDTHQGEVEADLITKTGQRLPFYFTGVGATIDDESFLVGVGLDLSEYKKTLKELQESEALYRLLAERMTEGVILVNNFKILFANNFFLSLFGYQDAPSLIGTDLRSMIAEGFEMYFKDMCEALEAGICQERFFQARWLKNKKDVIWVEGIANRLEWQGLPTVFLTVRDITETKLREISMQEEADNLRRQNVKLRSSIQERYRFGKIVGKSPAMQRIYEQILNASGTNASVVIYGESGTGKELVARAIHDMSRRSGKNFVPVNSSAIPENLLESEFFGHKKGAFTGAHADRAGYLDLANGGTLFLDEVGDLSINLQAKLLRALEEGTYSPVGSSVVKHSDFRLLSATNKDLKTMIHNGQLREDFFYRIHILPITLPPLRERKEDIPLVAEDFLKRLVVDHKAQIPGPVLE